MIEVQSTVASIFDGAAARVYTSPSRVRSLAITSTLHGEGATTVALGLAGSLASYETNGVLLIDGNWIRPALTAYAGLGAAPGLAECLRGDKSLGQVVAPCMRRGLSFLPAGGVGEGSPPVRPLPAPLGPWHRRFGG